MRIIRSSVAACAVSVLLALPVVQVAHAEDPGPAEATDATETTVPLDAAETVTPLAPAAPAGAMALDAAESVVKELSTGGGEAVGVSFETVPTGPVRVRVQQDDGTWGAWNPLDVEGGPDDGAPSSGRGATAATEPLWIGDGAADRKVQVSLGTADVADASLAVVDPGSSPVDDAEALLPAAAAATTAAARPEIRTRAQWGADERIRTCTPSSATLKAGTLHHAASANGYDADEVPAIIRSFYTYHVKTHGWCDIGYNFLVDRFGRAWEGRYGSLTKTVVGAHATGFNTGTVGVSMIGNYDTAATPAAMVETVSRVFAWRLGLAGINPKGTVRMYSGTSGAKYYGQTVTLPTIFAHRDVGYTTCPGRYGYAKMDAVRDRVAQLVSSPAAVPVAAVGIAAKYAALGGAKSYLGNPVTGETPLGAGAAFRHYQGGSIYDGPRTSAQVAKGSIRSTWAAKGWERSGLGFPTTDELATPDGRGRYNHFEGGSIYWTATTGAHDLHAYIRDAWAGLGWETSQLGYPTTDERRTPDGKGYFNHFQNGSVYWSAGTGAHEVHGPIRDRWASLGWEGGRMGFPTSDTIATVSGSTSFFQGGAIRWVAKTRTTTVEYYG